MSSFRHLYNSYNFVLVLVPSMRYLHGGVPKLILVGTTTVWYSSDDISFSWFVACKKGSTRKYLIDLVCKVHETYSNAVLMSSNSGKHNNRIWCGHASYSLIVNFFSICSRSPPEVLPVFVDHLSWFDPQELLGGSGQVLPE